jgi:hypothetical protein
VLDRRRRVTLPDWPRVLRLLKIVLENPSGNDALDLTGESQVLLKNLPVHAIVRIQFTAHNGAGESAKSTVVSVTLTSSLSQKHPWP